MSTSTTTRTGVSLKDPALFRQACYVDGAWVSAKSGARVYRSAGLGAMQKGE